MDEEFGPFDMPSALDDEQLRFFLENIKSIDRWARLADKVSAAVEYEYREILPGLLQQTAQENGLDFLVADRLSGEGVLRGPMLYRAAWRSPDADGPDVGVGLGLDGKVVLPAGAWLDLAKPPYVGILTSPSTDRGREIKAAVRPLAITELVGRKHYKKGLFWVVYRYVSATDDWYLDIPAWRASLVRQLLAAWRESADLIDRALAGLRPAR